MLLSLMHVEGEGGSGWGVFVCLVFARFASDVFACRSQAGLCTRGGAKHSQSRGPWFSASLFAIDFAASPRVSTLNAHR